MGEQISIVFLGATGAVGTETLNQVLNFEDVSKVLLLGRREIKNLVSKSDIEQQTIDIHNPESYSQIIKNYDTAICTLGVGEPSTMSREDFVKIDKTSVIHFAKVCKSNGVKHFQLLSSVGTNSKSRNFFLRTKGELIDELVKLNFERLSIFQPSMILTPQNRYGITQGLTLKIWPKLDLFLQNKLRKYRGIKVEMLGKAIANNIKTQAAGVEYLQYDDFWKLNKKNYKTKEKEAVLKVKKKFS